jgi:CRP/FNR family cyclic AMP-dependent transcriptional regulator
MRRGSPLAVGRLYFRLFAVFERLWDPWLVSDAVEAPDLTGKATLEILSAIDLFSGLPLTHLRRVVDIGVEEQYKSSATIFAEGESGDKFYLIVEGAVRISRFVAGMGEEALAILRPGAYFGEMSLIDDAPRSATAVCHERCRLFVVNRKDLEDLLFVDRDLAYELLWNWVRTLSRRLRAANDKMTFLATTSKF